MRASVLGLAVLVLACGEKQGMEAPKVPPPRVTVAQPVRRDITPYNEVPGRTIARESVEIRARVTGFLKEMRYEVGTKQVKKGDVLFVIEKDEYEAKKQQAEAAVAAAEAQLEKAKSDLARFKKAAESNAVSQVQVTQAKAEVLLAEASIKEAQAALRRADLDLSYCEVVSPIDGMPGRNLVDVGNLVGPNNSPVLTTVKCITPIWVEFDVPENLLNEALRMRAARAEGDKQPKTLEVQVATPGDEGYPHVGHVSWVANETDPDTGTLKVRALLPNPQQLLYSGVFVRVRIVGDPKPGQVLVEQQAIGTDLAGKYVLIVGKENIVERRYVQLGQPEGTMRVIEKGLKGDETYITVGVLRARPGLPVQPAPAASES